MVHRLKRIATVLTLALSFLGVMLSLPVWGAQPKLQKPADQELIRERDRLGEEAGRLRANGKLSEAISRVRRMVEIEEQISGPRDQEVAVVLDYLTDLLMAADDFVEATKTKTAAVSIWSEEFGADHWRTKSTQADLRLIQRKSELSPADRLRLAEAEDNLNSGHQRFRIGLLELAESRVRQAQLVFRDLLGKNSLLEGQAWLFLKRIHQARREWSEAAACIGRAKEIYAASLGEDHRDFAVLLQQESEVAQQQNDLGRAVRALKKCVAIRKQTLKPDDPRLRGTIEEWIDVCVEGCWRQLLQPDFADQRDALQGAIDESQKLLTPTAPIVRRGSVLSKELTQVALLDATSRRRLQAVRQRSRVVAEPDKSEPADQQLRRFDQLEKDRLTVEQLLSETTPLWIDVTVAIARLAEESGELEPATGLWTLAVIALGELYGGHSETHAAAAEVSRLLRSQARSLFAQSEWNDALSLLETHQKQFGRIFGEKDWRNVEAEALRKVLVAWQQLPEADRARWLHVMELRREATQARRQRRWKDTVQLLEKAVELVRQQRGETRYLRALMLHDLGVSLREAGELSRAVASLREAHAVWVDLAGPQHPLAADTAVEIAWWQFQVGDLSDALREMPNAVTAFRDAGAERELALARAEEMLGLCALDQHLLKAAEESLMDAFEIRRRRLGLEHRDVARAEHNLGVLYHTLSDLEAAVALFEKAADVWESQGEQAELARCLDQLGQVRLAAGEAKQAKQAFERAGAIFEKQLNWPADHPEVLVNLGLQAECHAQLGETQTATEQMRIVLAANSKRWRQTAAKLSVPQRLQTVEKLRRIVDQFVEFSRDNPELAEERYSAVLNFRGTVLNYEQQLASQARASASPAVSQALQELQRLQPEITSRVFLSAKPEAAEVNRRELDKLLRRRQQLEQVLSAEVGITAQPIVTTKALADSLPENTVVVDFHHVGLWRTEQGRSAQATSLVAFVVSPGQPVQVIELGSSAPIHEAIQVWRRSFGQSDSGHHPAAIELRRLVWDRLPASVHQAKTVVLSPEGLLGQFSWGALPGRTAETFLIEDQAVVVVSSAQSIPNLLQKPRSEPGRPKALLVGGINFNATKPETSSEVEVEKGLLWQPLPGTASEVQSVATQLRESLGADRITLLTDDKAQATEIRAAMQQAEWIHLATHGFFNPPELRRLFASQSLRSESDAGGLRFARSPTELEPEMLSGLVFAGANSLARGERTDAVISARELAGLDLSHVRLVCLSACETGLGEQHLAESSLGLCRSLHAAGARTCLASLWRVDDQATAQLMTEFYRHLLAGRLTTAECLQAAQLSLIRNKRATATIQRRGATLDSDPIEQSVGSPYFWAGFVLSGDWR